MIFLFGAIFSYSSFSCETPVYQFALANWEPDAFRLVVTYPENEGLLVIEKINAFREEMSVGGLRTNLKIIAIDINQPEKELPPVVQAIVKGKKSSWSVLIPPRSSLPLDSIWDGPIDLDAWKQLVTSSLRDKIEVELTKELASGVFLYVENKPGWKSNRFVAKLESRLNKLENKLRPSVDDGEIEVKFPLIKIDGNDIDEQLFFNMIKSCSGNKKILSTNFVAVIYGRARVSQLFSPSQLSASELENICTFLLGECACEIKADNPGFDLLFQADWLSADLPLTYSEFELPELVSVELFKEIQEDSVNLDGDENLDLSFLLFLIPLLFIFLISLFFILLIVFKRGRSRR